MDRRDLLLAAVTGLCANPKIAGVMPPAKIGALAVSVAKGVIAKLDPDEDERGVPPPDLAPPPPAPPVEGPKRGDIKLHAARHPHD